jgi:hypothetical protein
MALKEGDLRMSIWFNQNRGTHLPSFTQLTSGNASNGAAISGLAG